MDFAQPQAMVEFFVRMPAGDSMTFRGVSTPRARAWSATVNGHAAVDAGRAGHRRTAPAIDYVDCSSSTGEST